MFAQVVAENQAARHVPEVQILLVGGAPLDTHGKRKTGGSMKYNSWRILVNEILRRFRRPRLTDLTRRQRMIALSVTRVK